MKFYSDKTKKMYDTEAECLKAEKEFDELYNKKANAEKEAKAKLDVLHAKMQETTEAVKKANAANTEAYRVLQKEIGEFSRKYGYVPEKYRTLQFLTWFSL